MQGAGEDQVYRGNLDRLLTKLSDERGIELTSYRRQYVERRIATRLRALNLHSYRQYATYLDGHEDELAKMLDTLTINVTEFFRDEPVFDIFRREVVPMMIEQKLRTRHRMIRVWSAGCATGEEPYSIAMSFLEAMGEYEKEFLLTVVGTDVDEKALAFARKAEYPVERLKNIPKHHQVKYLQMHGEAFSIRPEVASHVKFRSLNLFSDRPINTVDVIFCRNVFIYFNRDQQSAILEHFWSALSRGGFLVLGRSEKLAPSVSKLFELHNARERIYRKPMSV